MKTSETMQNMNIQLQKSVEKEMLKKVNMTMETDQECSLNKTNIQERRIKVVWAAIA